MVIMTHGTKRDGVIMITILITILLCRPLFSRIKAMERE